MKTIEISGLEEAKVVECTVQVLGDPRLSDPVVSDDFPALERLVAVSSDGKWLALDRRARAYSPHLLTIARAEEEAEEIVVPLDQYGKNSQIRDINNEGALLLQGELDELGFDHGHSCRPVLFKVGDEGPLALPPLYEREPRWSARFSNRPPSHIPCCYTFDEKIFGWAYVRSTDDESCGYRYFLYEQQKPRVWTVTYLPDSLSNLWLRPAAAGNFVWVERKPKEGVIKFGSFDGTSCRAFDLEVEGENPKIGSVAENNTFVCQYATKGMQKNDKKAPKLADYTLLARPHDKAVQLFQKSRNKNPWLEKISLNGQYVIGYTPREGWFVLQAQGDGYVYRVLDTPSWRIDSLAHVMDDGRIYATATCVRHNRSHFRLKMPVMLVPQW